MRIFWMTVPKPLEAAVGACRRHFALAAGLSALINVLYLAPTIYMMQVYDRVVPTGGVQTGGASTQGMEQGGLIAGGALLAAVGAGSLLIRRRAQD